MLRSGWALPPVGHRRRVVGACREPALGGAPSGMMQLGHRCKMRDAAGAQVCVARHAPGAGAG